MEFITLKGAETSLWSLWQRVLKKMPSNNAMSVHAALFRSRSSFLLGPQIARRYNTPLTPLEPASEETVIKI
jgi:hypothetical protein